jgi:CheY-like chemotaxis protein
MTGQEFASTNRPSFQGVICLPALLDGLRILVLEDEALIAMDVEQLCRDGGAADVTVARDLDEIDLEGMASFDVAIVDLSLGGRSTLGLATLFRDRRIPFVFASGYSSQEEMAADFPGVPLVPKPYSGVDLVEAVAAVSGRLPMAEA